MRAASLTFEQVEPWVEAGFDRASGPGGQNVNKLNTRVTLLFDFEGCTLCTPAQRTLLRTRLRTRLARDGRLRVVAQGARTQRANRELAADRLIELIKAALHRDKPRRKTRATAASRERRLREKKRRGETKRMRQSRPDAD